MNKIRFFYPAKLLHIVVSFGVFLGLWQLIVSVGNFNQALLPAPTAAIAALWELIIVCAVFVFLAWSQSGSESKTC